MDLNKAKSFQKFPLILRFLMSFQLLVFTGFYIKKKNKNLFLPTLFSHMQSKQKLHDKMRIAILHVGLYY